MSSQQPAGLARAKSKERRRYFGAVAAAGFLAAGLAALAADGLAAGVPPFVMMI